MRISRLHAFWDTEYFGPAMCKKYGMEEYSLRRDKTQPTVFFGCYGRGTKIDIMNHRSLAIVVWSGSDSTRLHEVGEFVDYCRNNKDKVFHIAHSHWIQTDLRHFGLEYIDRVVLPVDLSTFAFEPQIGTDVYHYGSHQREWFYGTHLMKKLRTRWDKTTGYPHIEITGPNAYSKKELYEIYKRCFIGVRLTEHDNMALSCIEMGLMGRYSIFNGNIPCAIPYMDNPYKAYTPLTRQQWVWQDEGIMEKVGKIIFDRMHEGPSKELAEEMREFVYDDEKWLDTKFYNYGM